MTGLMQVLLLLLQPFHGIYLLTFCALLPPLPLLILLSHPTLSSSSSSSLSLRLFQKFVTFRILVCGGDGSVGWVLSELDKLNLHKQVRVGEEEEEKGTMI